MAQMPIREHVIRRIHAVTNKYDRPVTFREIYSTSARDREEIEATMRDLINEGLLSVTSTPKGVRGRPTSYFYLTNNWVPAEVTDPFEQPGRIVETDQPNPVTDLHHLEPAATGKVFTWSDFDVDPNDVLSTTDLLLPYMYLFIKNKQPTMKEILTHFGHEAADVPTRTAIVRAFNFFYAPAYEGHWTKFSVNTVDKPKTSSGARDQRIADRYAPKDPPPLQYKEDQMRDDQQRKIESVVKRSGETPPDTIPGGPFASWFEWYGFTEPSPDPADMSEFEARLAAIR